MGRMISTRGTHPVVVDLTRAQVEQVVRATGDAGAVSMLLDGVGVLRRTLGEQGRARAEIGDPRLSRSLLLGLMLFASLPADGSSVSITQLAKLNETNNSTTHRYASTLVAAGLVEQDPKTRRYRLACDVHAPRASGK
jgi:IclR helix-turn-helix domain